MHCSQLRERVGWGIGKNRGYRSIQVRTRSPVAGRCRKVTASCSPQYSPEFVRGSFVVLAVGKACTTQPAIFSQTIAFLK